MGFGTYLYTDLYFNRKTYNSLYEVEEDFKRAQDRISHARARLKVLAFMTEPQKFCVNEESPDTYLEQELEYALEELEEALIDTYKLNMLKECWKETHDSEGKAIRPSDEERKPFICGDFIE